MKKPNRKDFSKPFGFDSNLMVFNSKAYSKKCDEYIAHLEKVALKKIEDAYREGLRTGNLNSDISPFLITSQVRAFEIFTV